MDSYILQHLIWVYTIFSGLSVRILSVDIVDWDRTFLWKFIWPGQNNKWTEEQYFRPDYICAQQRQISLCICTIMLINLAVRLKVLLILGYPTEYLAKADWTTYADAQDNLSVFAGSNYCSLIGICALHGSSYTHNIIYFGTNKTKSGLPHLLKLGIFSIMSCMSVCYENIICENVHQKNTRKIGKQLTLFMLNKSRCHAHF